MNPALLALFLRSVREDARGWRTYGVRGVLSGFVLLVLLPYSVANFWVGAPGREFLVTIVTFQIVTVTFVGLSYFTSAITEEKEEFTIGLLRMTGLSALSILLGKSTSRLCGVLLLLTSQIPFTIFAMTLGGVSLRQVATVYCTLAAYTFFLSNLALLGSVVARRTIGAAMFCISVLILWVAADFILDFVGSLLPGPGILTSACQALSKASVAALPSTQLHEAFGTSFGGSVVGWQVASNVAAGLCCFLLAWALFGVFCDRRPEDQSLGGTAWTALVGRRRLRPPRAWGNAVLWKDFYFLYGGYPGLFLHILGYGGALLFLGTDAAAWITFVYSLELGMLASRIFRVELNDRTLAALALLPCGLREVALAKSRACLTTAIPGGVAMVTAQLLALSHSDGSKWIWAFLAACGLCAMFVLVHVVAWLSLRMKRGAFVLGYAGTILGCTFAFGYCALIIRTMFSAELPRRPDAWFNGVADLFAGICAIMVFCGALAPAWIFRGSMPAELADLAGEE